LDGAAVGYHEPLFDEGGGTACEIDGLYEDGMDHVDHIARPDDVDLGWIDAQAADLIARRRRARERTLHRYWDGTRRLLLLFDDNGRRLERHHGQPRRQRDLLGVEGDLGLARAWRRGHEDGPQLVDAQLLQLGPRATNLHADGRDGLIDHDEVVGDPHM